MGKDFDPREVAGPMFLHEVGGNIGEKRQRHSYMYIASRLSLTVTEEAI